MRQIERTQHNIFGGAKNREVWQYLQCTAVFIASFLLAFCMASIFMPVDSSRADTDDSTGNFSLEVGTSEKADIDIVPTRDGNFAMSSATIVVKTGNKTGYTLTMSDADDNTDLVGAQTNSTISSIDTEVEQVDFPINKWGYSIDGGENFLAIPTLNEPKTIEETSSANPDDGNETIVTFGT